MEKQYIRTVVILPFDIQYFTIVLSILKQCETVRTVQEYGKKNSTKKVRSYRFGIQLVELLSYFCTIFCDFS